MAMEIEYHLTFDDMLAFERQAQKHVRKIAPAKMRGPWAWVRYVMVGVVALFIAAFYSGLLGTPDALLPFLLGLAVGVLWLFVLGVGLSRGRLRSLREFFEEGHARWVLAPRRLTISPEGFHVVNYYLDSMNRWEQVWQISVTEDHAFFFITPLQVHIVPRRAFRDPQHFGDFVVLARQYQQGRAPAEWPQSSGITTAAPALVTNAFRPDIPEPTP
jgi:hypothetical protein